MFRYAKPKENAYKGTPSPLVDPLVCAYSLRMGLNFLGRRLRRSRDVWRFRLRNDAGKAARQTRRFDAVETLLQLLSLGAVRTLIPVGEGLAPPVCAERKVKPVGEGLRSLANDLLPRFRCYSFARRERQTVYGSRLALADSLPRLVSRNKKGGNAPKTRVAISSILIFCLPKGR